MIRFVVILEILWLIEVILDWILEQQDFLWWNQHPILQTRDVILQQKSKHSHEGRVEAWNHQPTSAEGKEMAQMHLRSGVNLISCSAIRGPAIMPEVPQVYVFSWILEPCVQSLWHPKTNFYSCARSRAGYACPMLRVHLWSHASKARSLKGERNSIHKRHWTCFIGPS